MTNTARKMGTENAARISADQIKADMPVVCSRNGQFGVVDHMQGSDSIKLKKDASGQHHYIPLSWVEGIEGGKVKVDRPGDEAMQQWSTEPPRASMNR